MRHFTEDELAQYAFDSQSAPERVSIEDHLGACPDCAERLHFIRTVDAELADPDAWEIAGESEDASSNQSLFDFAAKIAGEAEAAERLLRPLLKNPAAFVWSNISQRRTFRTAGAVRALSRAAMDTCYSKPLHALTYADAAIAVAEALRIGEYPAHVIYDLRGTAWKDRANALRLLGRFDHANDALDRAERAFLHVPEAPLGPTITKHLRAIILYERSDFHAALQFARECSDIFARLGDTERHMNARHLEANILFQQHDYTGARTIYREIFAHAEATNDLVWIAREARTLAHCDLELGDLTSAARYFHQSLQAFVALEQDAEVTKTRWGIASLVLRGGNWTEALRRLRAVRAEFVELQMLIDEALVVLDMMDALLALARPQEIVVIAGELVERFMKAGMLTSALTAFAYLREAAEAGRVTARVIEHVRQFIRRVELEPSLLFAPPPHLD